MQRNHVGLIVLALGWSLGCGNASKANEGTSDQAVFTNPDFETDPTGAAPAGWTVQANLNPAITDTRPSPQTLASLNLGTGGVAMTTVVGGAPESQTDPDIGASNTFRYPKYGNHAARVNYQDATVNGKNKNVNLLRQTMTVSLADVDPMDDQVHIRFTVAPVLEDPAHAYNEQPYYFVRLQNLTTSTTVYQDFNIASTAGVPWKAFTDASGNAAAYVDWSLVDIASTGQLAVGDQVELLVLAAGCSRNGHWGRIYVDSFGENIPGLYAWARGPQTANAGSNLTYTISYRNGGTNTTYNTKLDLVTPPNTTFVSTSLGAACTTPAVGATGTMSCALGTLAPDSEGSFTVTLNVPAGTAAATVITNGNYSIYADAVSPLIGSKVATTVTSGSTYSDVKVTATDGKASIGWGQPTSYTITVTNSGPAAATNIAVADTMPAQLTGVTWTCSATGGGTCAASGSGNISDTATLPANAVATYLVHATIVAGTGAGSIKQVVTATVSGSSTDPDSTSNTSVDITAIGTPQNLTITKSTAASFGMVRSEPAGLTCGTSCTTATAAFNDGTQVVLDASASAGATFVGWGGACSGTSTTCTITMAGALSVTARFAGPPTTAPGGAAQRTAINTAFGQPVALTVLDSAGTPVPGVTVTFAPPGSGASAALGATTAVTNALGVASVTATANATPGGYSVTATVAGIATPTTFSLANLGPPASVTTATGSPQSAPVNTAFGAPLVVTVRDAANQVLSGVNVTFTAPGSGASATPSPTTVATDATGTAQLAVTANTIAGAYTVSAGVAGVATPASFVLTNVAGAGTTLAIISGNSQSTTVNTAFAAPFVAAFTDAFGNPVAGATLTFAAPASGASATLSTPAVTNAQGRASATGTARTTSGSFSITVSATGAAAIAFTATATAGAPASIAIGAGTGQSTTVNTAFGAAMSVTVLDAFGNPVPNATVAFAGPSTGARATFAATVTTDAAGHAAITPTANTVAGSYAITATVAGLPPVSFSATNVAGAASAISAQSGGGQSARVGVAFGAPLVAVVVDSFGNPVAGATVTFAAPGSGASATFGPASASSNASGVVSTTAAAGTVTGAYTATASLAGGASASFALTNTAGTAAAIAIVSGSPQSAAVATAFAASLIVEVRDSFGNLVPGASVGFTAPGSGATATLSAASATTNASGRAQITAAAGNVTGSYNVTATAGSSSTTFALTNTAGAPASIAVVSGSGQSAAVATAFAAPLIAVVHDSFGNPVPGASVAFAAPGGTTSATLSAAAAITGSDGQAQITATANTRVGSYAVSATVGSAPAASFALTNTAGPAATLTAISGGAQSTRVATAFPAPLIVEVRDAFDNLITGADVSFTAPAAGASAVVPATATTNSSGRAQVAVSAGNVAGAYQVVASTTGAPDVSFALTNVPGAASAITITDGDAQQTTVLQPLAHPLAVLVADALGNPIAGATVTLHAPASDPTAQLADQIVTTASDGSAATTASAGQRAGSYDVTASIPGATATFHLQNLAAAPAVVLATAGSSPQSATVLTAFAAPLDVTVEDAYGNACAGATVTFAGPPSGARADFAATTVQTGADGHAQVIATAGAVTGSYLATATVAGIDPAAFSLTNLAGAPTQVVASAGDAQSATVNTDFAAALEVLVTDGEGNPVPNATVVFSAPATGATGTLAASSVATDATGHAVVTVHASTAAGGYVITATAADGAAPATFSLTNLPDAAVLLSAARTSTPQGAQVAITYAAPLAALVTDQYGNGVPGVTVTFTAPASGPTGTPSAPSVVTDATGRASVTLLAGTTAGEFTVTAASAGLASATFDLTNLSGAATLLSLRRGAFQSTTVATAFATPLVARLQDALGNVVTGVTITFQVPATGARAQLSAATAVTDANGEVTITATASTVAGSYEVTASAPQSEAPVVFALTNTPGAAASASFAPGSTPQSAQVGHGFAAPLAVVVVDAYGNRVPGAAVTFAAPASEPTAVLSDLTVTTDADGTADVLAVAGHLGGSYTVTVTVDGIATPLTIALTNTAGAASSLVAVSGAGQHAMATTAFGAPVVMRVVDTFGNAIANASVTLAAPATGASGVLSSTQLTSDGDGIVRVTLVANASPGDFNVVATAADSTMALHVTLSVDPIPTTTTITAADSAPVDQPLATTVTITAQLLVAAGAVELLDDAGNLLGHATLDGTGTAQVAGTLVSRGHHAITARFTAQGSFGASSSAALDVEATHDSGTLTGAGTDGCNARHGSGGLGFLLVIGALLASRSRRRLVRLALALALVPAFAASASAQSAGSRSIDRLHPAASDSEWFALDSVEFAGHREISVAVVGDYAYRPLVIYNANDSRRVDIVRDQLVLHFGAAVTLFDRFRLSANAPLAAYQDGDAADYNGMTLPQPTYSFGDVTVAGDVRVAGQPGGRLRAAVGVRGVFPTGSKTNYTSDGIFAADLHGMVAGTLGRFEYAGGAQLLLREETRLADEQFGSELRLSLGLGTRLAGGKLVVGPELMSVVPVVSDSGAGHPLELGLGLHYRISDAIRVGVGASVGLVHAVGTPQERGLLSFAWLL